LLTQGAEALVYRTTHPTPSQPAILKHRPAKPYRHPILDARLSRFRLLSEARMLLKAARAGICVPGVRAADWDAGWLVLEDVGSWTVRRVLREQDGKIDAMLRRVGLEIAKLHRAGCVHGDLTTSNIMLRSQDAPPDSTSAHATDTGAVVEEGKPPLDAPIVLIDFGLAQSSIQHEDRAVDLYVLERAFAATHPIAEPLFKIVLEAYATLKGYSDAKAVLRRLEDVRMRGRKKSMLG
ncbi:Serine/threonine-protein kinase BUD32, partial [Pseudovirgaria hyperparasitica]